MTLLTFFAIVERRVQAALRLPPYLLVAADRPTHPAPDEVNPHRIPGKQDSPIAVAEVALDRRSLVPSVCALNQFCLAYLLYTPVDVPGPHVPAKRSSPFFFFFLPPPVGCFLEPGFDEHFFCDVLKALRRTVPLPTSYLCFNPIGDSLPTSSHIEHPPFGKFRPDLWGLMTRTLARARR